MAPCSFLAINGGSSSIRFALFDEGEPPRRLLNGKVDRVGLVADAAVLAWSGQRTLSGLLGPLAIIGACAAWRLDNNLTRKVSLADPLQVVELKGLIAGPVNLALGLLAGGTLPGLSVVSLAGIVGFLGMV